MRTTSKFNRIGSALIIPIILAVAVSGANSARAAMTYLEITPVTDFESSGEIGGPFAPASKEYQLKNTDVYSLYWGVDVSASWLDIDPEQGWGELDPNESVIVTISLNSIADTLGGGVHTDTITFTDMTNDEEETRGVSLTITAPLGELEITPVDDFESSGEPGGPFTPPSKDYQLTNTGGSPLDWGVSKTVDWLDLGPETWGELDPCESTIVTVSLNSNAELLGEGVHADTVTFTDITNLEEQTRGVTLTITSAPGIWIDPNGFSMEIIEGTTLNETLTVGNDGGEDLNFSISTRVVGVSGQSAGEKSGVFSIPAGYDFTVAGDAPYKEGELIVRFAPRPDGKSASPTDKQQILSSLGGGTITRDFDIVPGLSVVELAEGMTVEDALEQFNQADGIFYAQPNYEIHAISTFPNDTRFDDLWGMHNTGQTGGIADADIDAPEAWDLATGSSEVIVAVIDTGVDYNHVDLAQNMWVNTGEIPGNGEDDDDNGYVDDVYGYDFCNGDGNPMDDHYHGTHCAGTIGGIGNNNEGVAGVCWNVKIMAVKFLDSGGGGWTDDAIDSVQYSVLMGANLSSNSWGGGGYSQGLKDAIDAAGAAGMLFVAAAGNDYGSNNDTHPHYPSSYTCDSVIAVLSTDDDDDMSGFSNYGPTSVDLGAPGSDILSCNLGGGYHYKDGTSMATPHVSGACALLWSMNSMLTNTEVKEILLDTVDLTLGGLCVSGGRLNLYNAILETSAPWLEIEPEEGVVGPGDTNDISVTFDAMTLAPGVYAAEIVVTSNDPVRPTIIIPATMTVLADALQATPVGDFESSGTKGGPFSPACKSYTLINEGIEAISWSTSETPVWLRVNPSDGVLDPNEFVVVNVCIDPNANLLEPGLYTESLIFLNEDSGSSKVRTVSLTVLPPDIFTELFDDNDNDLAYTMLTFRPDGSSAYYAACKEPEGASSFPTDPNDGTYVALWDDDFAEVVLDGGDQISFYGQSYDRLYIGSNGYITFGDGDTEWLETLDNHFWLPRISALFVDLAPSDGECISYKQLDDSIVVTFEDVPLYGDKDAVNSFQVQIFFADETIWVTYLDLAAGGGIAGLSEGNGVPAFYVESDLSEYIQCCVCGDFNGDRDVNLSDFVYVFVNWLRDDCAGFDWCERTDIDRSGNVGADDVGLAAYNWLIGTDPNIPEYSWTEPIFHGELTHPGGFWGAIDPALSNDERTIYFRCHDLIYDENAIWEAHRDEIGEPFTGKRVLTEIFNDGEPMGSPWATEDGLHLYYYQWSGSECYIKMAERATTNDTWTHVRTFDEIHTVGIGDQLPTLTADELTMFYGRKIDGITQIWTTTRPSIEEPFSDIAEVSEINDPCCAPWQPSISPDGLTIYYTAQDGSEASIYKATRSSTGDPFGDIEVVDFCLPDKEESHPYVTPDGTGFYFFGSWVGGLGIYEVHRESLWAEGCLPR